MPNVHIEFQRVQSWLFAVPKLRAMIGANTLLGETLRETLPDLAKTGNWKLSGRANDSDKFAFSSEDDPLETHETPAQDAAAGILARDGGHFEASFKEEGGAASFARAAILCLQARLPGLRFRVSIDKVPVEGLSRSLPTELPVLSVCKWTGHGLASAEITQGDEQAFVSADVVQRHAAEERARKGKATDLASLLTRSTNLGRYRRPTDFNEFAGNGYLAVIHADGNSVGSAAPDEDPERGRFFHRNRVLLRAALAKAIDECITVPAQTAKAAAVSQPVSAQKINKPRPPVAPLIILMLGGDDILVVCQARIAVPFVIALCRHLRDAQPTTATSQPVEEPLLTLGVGLVIARPSLPFHRLHAVAEALTSSAKRRYRGLEDASKASVVDWAVYTNSWAEDPGEVRRRDWVRGGASNRRILSRRPLPVLDDATDTSARAASGAQTTPPGKVLRSLESMNAAASNLKTAARSQLRYLTEQLPRGRVLSDLAFEEMSPASKVALEKAGIERIWEDSTGDSPTAMTSVLDIVELYEISRLGRTTKSEQRVEADVQGESVDEVAADVDESTQTANVLTGVAGEAPVTADKSQVAAGEATQEDFAFSIIGAESREVLDAD